MRVRTNEAIVYGTAVLAGAALVFQIQPIAGKLLLPSFGGGASVWTACMFFFQSVLLAGYAYAHVLTACARPRNQALVHAAFLAVSALFLPIGVGSASVAPGGSAPGWQIFSILLTSTAVPLVMLASTAPLVQRWSSLTRPAQSPYHLYALSNTGALLALLSYPVLLEPNISLRAQTLAWSLGYGVFLAVSLAACGLLWRCRVPAASQINPAAGSNTVSARAGGLGTLDGVLVLLLSASGVIMLLAVTNQITQNVAPVPFLWILPLTAYLLTYIMCFSGERWYDRSIWGSLFIVAASSLILLDFFGTSFEIVPVVAAYLLVLACACMVCHGELYRLRPAPGRLTIYYLLIAAGGAAGGAFVSLVAPAVFTWYWEALLGAYLIYLLLGTGVLREARGRVTRARRSLAARIERWGMVLFAAAWILGIFLLPALALMLGSMRAEYDVASVRNFYGLLNVRDVLGDGVARRLLVDGTTIHGYQLLEDGKEQVPTSYYGPNTGISLLLQNYQRDDEGLSMGIVGLGAGTLAAYGQPSDEFRFYELNPAVVAIADRHFSFLASSEASIDVVLGDARISMAEELQHSGSRRYDIIVIDAFTSDAIPVHLLTLEALELYFAHLEPGGALAFHVTNNYLDLAPVVARLAAHFDQDALLVETRIDTGETSVADWVLVAQGWHLPPEEEPEGLAVTPLSPEGEGRIWTDDYSDLLGTLRR